MDRKLLCYAFGRDDRWEAICVDFDLAIQGTSFRGVQDGLNALIKTYITDARKETEADARRLLDRRAPLLVRARLALQLLWNLTVTRGKSDGDHYAGYDISCPA